MHHKFAIVDGRLLINGSFNWTRQAVLYNQENCVITDNSSLVSSVGLLGCPGFGQQGLAVGCSCGISQQRVTHVLTVRPSAPVLDK